MEENDENIDEETPQQRQIHVLGSKWTHSELIG